jgi:hypothetical protein
MSDDLQVVLSRLTAQLQRLETGLIDLRRYHATHPETDNDPEETVESTNRDPDHQTGGEAHPFDSSEADLILRSLDGAEFKVFKRILSEGSKFFRTMFTLPTNDAAIQPIPTVDVPESSQLIRVLLQFLYPIPDPPVSSLTQLNELLATAIKYDMEGVSQTLRTLLVSHKFASSDPFAAFTIAIRHQLIEEIKVTASWTFSISLLDMPLTEDHRFITAYEFFQLLKLHRRRAKEYADTIRTFGQSIRCPGCLRRNDDQGCLWWKDWEARAFEEVQKRPCTKIVFSPAFIAKSAKAAIENRAPCFDCPLHIHSSQNSLETLRMKLDSLPIIL